MNETVAFNILACILGLVLGSFYNVCIHRGITGESVVNPPRSKCPNCGHFLSWWENIPLLSYLILRGRCHSCKQGISIRYPVVEALSGAIALALSLKFGPGAKWAVYMAFSGLLIVLGFIDLATMFLPLYPMLIGAGAALICAPLFLGIPLLDAGLAAGTGAGCFWAVRAAYKRLRGIEGLGEGDIWLMLLIGPLVGLDQLPFVIIVSGLGLVATSVFFLRGGNESAAEVTAPEETPSEQGDNGEDEERGALQTPIPYGPFLCAAAIAAVLVGREVLHWYTGLMR
ncbi:MAG: prepilin peptidase [Proteobacteria bacterium]|nr:prepilin peptidase [Pseudomonadota bacterium]